MNGKDIKIQVVEKEKANKIILFYENACLTNFKALKTDWYHTKQAIENGDIFIATTQMGLLSTRLFELGYKIFIHQSNGKTYEIKLGDKNTCTDKDIRLSHNLFRMWIAGAFQTSKGVTNECSSNDVK